MMSRNQPSHYRPDIQGLRALAVTLVVVNHGLVPTGRDHLVVPGGFVGVDVFFVISGFVIGRGLLAELSEYSKINLLDFYARRARRILPAFAAMVLIVSALCVPFLALTAQEVAGDTSTAASLFGSNLKLMTFTQGYFDPSSTSNPFLHLWSLSLEEQFYFLLPALLLGIWGLASRGASSGKRNPTVVLGIALALIAVGSVSLSVLTPDEKFNFYMLPTRMWEFLAGVLLVILTPRHLGRVLSNLCAWLGLGAILLSARLYDSTTPFPGLTAIAPVLGATLLILAGTSTNVISRTLSTRPATYIGDLSYSWYLWHWPLIVLAGSIWPGRGAVPPIAAALSLVPAWLSRRLVENAFRISKPDRPRTVLVPAIVSLAVVAMTGQLLTIGSRHAWGDDSLEMLNARTRARELGCHFDKRTGKWPSSACTFSGSGAEGFVFLLGDSHAISISDAVTSAAAKNNLGTKVWTQSSCAFRLEPSPVETCAQWRQDAMQKILLEKPDLVVIANLDVLIEGEEQVSEFKESLSSTVSNLNRNGIRVILTKDWPSYPKEMSLSLLGAHQQGQMISRATVEKISRARDVVIDEIATENRAMVVDSASILCSEDECRNKVGSTWLYYDRHHLSLDGAERLVPVLAEAIETLLHEGK